MTHVTIFNSAWYLCLGFAGLWRTSPNFGHVLAPLLRSRVRWTDKWRPGCASFRWLDPKSHLCTFWFPVLVNILSSPRSFRLLHNFDSLWKIYARAASGNLDWFGHGRVAVVMSITGCRNQYFRHDCHCRKPYMEERGRGTALSSTLPHDMFSGGI